jgi:hypothetical protein
MAGVRHDEAAIDRPLLALHQTRRDALLYDALKQLLKKVRPPRFAVGCPQLLAHKIETDRRLIRKCCCGSWLLGYLYGITSERKLLEELRMHMAWRWFTGLGFEAGDSPSLEVLEEPAWPLSGVDVAVDET